MKKAESKCRTSPLGFSLIEIMVALLLLLLLVSIAIPSINSLLGLNVKRSAVQIQEVIRDVYMKAALSSSTMRLVFDFEKNQLWAEETLGHVSLKEKGFRVGSEKKGSLLSEEEQELRDHLGDEAKEKSFLLSPDFTPLEGELGEKRNLLSGVRFESVWAEHLEEEIQQGQAAIYFFPGGYMQNAIVVVSDLSGKDMWSVVADPLTGRSRLEDHDIKPSEIGE